MQHPRRETQFQRFLEAANKARHADLSLIFARTFTRIIRSSPTEVHLTDIRSEKKEDSSKPPL